ncbi:MAG: sigma-54 dependent transcriptional regulator [candidate division WOR-3 bacterium]
MAEEYTILVVEDEENARKLLLEYLGNNGYKVFGCATGEEALQFCRENFVDFALLDIRLPGVSGIDLIPKLKETNPLIKVIMVTALGDVDLVVRAMSMGASDYVVKPVNLEKLLAKIEEIKPKHIEEVELKAIKDISELHLPEFVYASDKMKKVLYYVVRAARSNAPCLITGETGTGKTALARIIHSLSSRRDGPFVDVHLQSIPETLIESELFGYEKGAFTGADKSYEGLIVRAQGGTLFLDEIGELKREMQVKLLKVIEEKMVRPVGGTQPKKVDFRLITATNRDIKKEVKQGTFREDLYYRINVIEIAVPPLRERREDIPVLLDYFLKKYSKSEGKEIKGFSKEALKYLLRYHYPGNVRELSNIVERATVMATKNVIDVSDLPEEVVRSSAAHSKFVSGGVTTLPEVLKEIEKNMILEALKEENFVKLRAAKKLGISERVLRYKMKLYGIEDGKGDS